MLSAQRRTDLGKRVAVTAGLFGLLAVLAQLCFLFPTPRHDALRLKEAP